MTIQLLRKSVFEPQELSELQAIFDEIIAQPWFMTEKKDDFAKYLFETLPLSMTDVTTRRSTIEASARMFLSRYRAGPDAGMPSEGLPLSS